MVAYRHYQDGLSLLVVVPAAAEDPGDCDGDGEKNKAQQKSVLHGVLLEWRLDTAWEWLLPCKGRQSVWCVKMMTAIKGY